jgi:hypothetical protein
MSFAETNGKGISGPGPESVLAPSVWSFAFGNNGDAAFTPMLWVVISP